MSWSLIWEHLYIVLLSVLASLAVGLPLGVLAYLYPRARRPILWISDLFQTIPSLALLGIIMVFLGAGKPTVVFGITLYSLLPIVRNTCLGLSEVDPALKEAARGCGMNRSEQLFRVELPLARPVIFTGIRIAVVNAIGTAVFAAFVGGGGLGSSIYQGIRTQNMQLILLPTLALMVIAAGFDALMGLYEKHLGRTGGGGKRGKLLPILTAAALCAALAAGTAAYGGGKDADALTIYDGNYSETQILTHMVKYLVEYRTDLTVNIKDQMTAVNQFNELTAAQPSCDLMVSYDGTLLTTFLHQDTSDIPAGTSLYDYVNQQATDQYGVRLLEKLGLNNTYAIAVPEKIAEQYGLNTVSDLIPVADQLIFGAEHEFFTQAGSMKYGPFTEFYGLNFKDAVSVDLGLKYAAIENGSFQVTEVYATDGLNRKASLKILEDDRSFFPEYNGAILVRNDIFEKFAKTAPDLEDVLNELGGLFTNETMTDLTYAVDVQGRSVDSVAREFLVQHGMLG
jgi:Periplasmic glycine betaine/choline-binding (lipo)protein of an ABC-type transport system (osmoprotectant binding protein)